MPGAITEWVVRNHTINLAPGTSALFTSPAFLWGWNSLLGPQCFWMRMTISQVALEPSSYPDGWDGSGAFDTGETEDYLFHPDVPRDTPGTDPWTPPGDPQKPHRPRKRQQDGAGPNAPPPPPPPPAGAKRPRPPLAPDLVIIPASQTVPHGTTALAHVVKVPATYANPVLSGWQVNAGFRNGALDAGSPMLLATNGTYYPFGAPAQYALWGSPSSGAPAGTVNTISINSLTDPRFPSTEDWPLTVSGSFPGNLARTASGIIRVRHSENLSPGDPVDSGIPGLYESGRAILDDSVIAEPDKTNALNFLNSSRIAFESGQLAAALADLNALKTMGLPGITSEEQTRLLAVINFLDSEITAIQSIHGAVPVPVIEWPTDGEYVSGNIELLITHLYPDAEVDSLIAEHRHPVTGDWLPLPLPPIRSQPGQWLQPVDTQLLADGMHEIRVTLSDAFVPDNRASQALVALRVDNTPPAPPSLLAPAADQSVGSNLHVEATADTPDAWVASVEISANGDDWVEMATDYHAPDGWMFNVDTSTLAGGAWWVRVTCSDPAENSASSIPVQVNVQPSYPSWRLERGITSDFDDLDGDSIPAILEYYAGLDPAMRESPAALEMNIERSDGDFFLRCLRRQYYDGLSVIVEVSSDLGITDPWVPFAYDPPRETSGHIRVALPEGSRQFGRLRLEP